MSAGKIGFPCSRKHGTEWIQDKHVQRTIMNRLMLLAGKVRFAFGLALLGTLAACTTYVEQPRAYQEPPPPAYSPPPVVEADATASPVEVDIRSESDFYEPLNPYGHW